jgi:hypothetical protein
MMGMCYILCTTSSIVYYIATSMQGGLRVAPPIIFCFLKKCVTFFLHFSCHLNFSVRCWAVFRNMIFANGFLFPFKELGSLG